MMKSGSGESALRKARPMRGKGITYDTGFFNAGVSTHEPFDSGVVKREMHIINKVLEDRPGSSYPDMAWEPRAAFTALANYYHS